MQVVTAVAPSKGEYVPALHGWHVSIVSAPSSLLHVPAGHLRQASSTDVPPGIVPYQPAGHCSQSSELPITLLHVPFSHGVQSAKESAPSLLERVPAGQATHWAVLFIPAVLEYLSKHGERVSVTRTP